MDILLNNDDLAFLDSQIKKMPFEYGHPLFQFFTAKIQQVKQAIDVAENTKAESAVDTDGGAEVPAQLPKKAVKLKKA